MITMIKALIRAEPTPVAAVVVQGELADLAPSRLKERGRVFREAFLTRLALLMRGTVSAPPDQFGETLADEHIRGGAPSLCA